MPASFLRLSPMMARQWSQPRSASPFGCRIAPLPPSVEQWPPPDSLGGCLLFQAYHTSSQSQGTRTTFFFQRSAKKSGSGPALTLLWARGPASASRTTPQRGACSMRAVLCRLPVLRVALCHLRVASSAQRRFLMSTVNPIVWKHDA